MKKTILLMAIALVSACAPSKKETVNLSGYSPEFRAGYADGCESSKRASGRTRDEARFKQDAQYASGWRDGFDICTRKHK